MQKSIHKPTPNCSKEVSAHLTVAMYLFLSMIREGRYRLFTSGSGRGALPIISYNVSEKPHCSGSQPLVPQAEPHRGRLRTLE